MIEREGHVGACGLVEADEPPAIDSARSILVEDTTKCSFACAARVHPHLDRGVRLERVVKRARAAEIDDVVDSVKDKASIVSGKVPTGDS